MSKASFVWDEENVSGRRRGFTVSRRTIPPHPSPTFLGRPRARIVDSNPITPAVRDAHPSDPNGVPRSTLRRIEPNSSSLDT
jgi:hypothetical protein